MSRFFSSLLQKINPLEKKTPSEIPQVPKPEPEYQTDTFTISPRLLLMPFPTADQAPILQSYLSKHFNKKFMIWNLSEYPHPTSTFSSQTLDFIFVGYPNPPLSVIFSIFSSIQGWLKLDQDNVALIHCQATKGRSFMIISSYLTWTQEYSSVIQAFKKLCSITQQNIILLPSQLRYMNYIQEILNSPPQTKKITIHKIILDGIPIIEQEGTAIRPYLQIFRNSELVYNSHSKDFPPVSYYKSDISIAFDMDLEIEGDVFIRCRHLGKDSKPLTIFRVMFHTAFCQDLVMRFHKSELDGACNDHRFPESFNLDVLLEKNVQSEDDSLQQLIGLNRSQNNSIVVELAGNEEDKKKEESKKEDESDDEMDDYFKHLESK
ncbi:hypothetical protein SteCoe_23880 [Stentor coeruleus]|uniref:Uncharacterized protein n=1 Tax=Stentor coeruleus TaxID=5963 RepID=A0A1R2BIY4_9CILI|nr:hypothetical protein SteCoe_23880 [Stentor coeruleus]